MIGYKAFDKNLQCRGFQYEVGKTYVKETPKEELQLCTNKVFHFCRELHCIEKCSDYRLSESRICEVIAGNDIIVSDDRTKYGTNKLTILREIVGDEKNNLINSGDYNSGYYNSGNYNSGYRNSGDYNSGYRNSGDCNSGDRNSGDRNSGDRNSGDRNSGKYNSGYRNSGDRNSGDCNSGDRNSGDCNSGYRNSGDRNSGYRNSGNYNSGDYNSGYCNSKDAPVRMFNKETSAIRDEIVFPDFFHFEMTVFVSYDTASDIERKAHKKEIETCGGYLKTIDYKEAWRKSWDKANDADRRKVLNLPNWNNEVFFEITGIDVEKELGIKK